MTWIAISDKKHKLFNPKGLSHATTPAAGDLDAHDATMPSGSILMETRLSPEDRPQLLLGLDGGLSRDVNFSIRAVPGGGIALVHSMGAYLCHGAINLSAEARTDILRITYSWDMAHRWARLSVERPETGHSDQIILKDPLPVSLLDIREMVLNPAQGAMAADVCFLAVSDCIEPIGPMPGLTAQTPIATAYGTKWAKDIKRGDLLETLDGASVPVLQVVRRTVPARGLFEPVRLRTPYFGLKCDVTMSSTQRLVIGGSRVEYLFNAEQVLVPARHLINHTAALPVRDTALVTYLQFLLPDHEAINAAGTYVETLDIGRIRRRPNLLRSSLLGQFERNMLPEHNKTAYPVLGSFEALILAEQRAA